ncbi:DUF3800 domain-containing protein [bacterium]|nr:DUF3800 domain-containing protein [bacterium]
MSYLPLGIPPPVQPLYIFVDEYGNFDFSPKGTPYLIRTALSCQRPFWWYPEVSILRHDLIEQHRAMHLEYFHATDDSWPVRKALYKLIAANVSSFRIDSIIIEKRMAHPLVRRDERFYPEHLGTLLKYVISGWHFHQAVPETIVITDRLPHERKRRAVEKAIKTVLKHRLSGSPFRVYHFQSRSEIGLQIADYCCWAIQRKWMRADEKWYKAIMPAISSEFEVYREGATAYY